MRAIEVLASHENQREPPLLVVGRLLQEEALCCLIDSGCDTRVVNASGNTALHVVANVRVADINTRQQIIEL